MNNLSKSNELSSFVDSSWVPTEISKSKALATEILSSEFQNNLKNMLEAFSKIIPKEHDSSGKAFVSMAAKYQLLETYFPFGGLRIFTQFINNESSNAVCSATLHVLTEDGYEPWFSRMGMSNSDDHTTDGPLADAETSASRRLLVALGLGYEGAEEIVENNKFKNIQQLNSYLLENGLKLKELVSKYRDQQSKYGLGLLSGKYDTKTPKSELTLKMISDDDFKKILSFIAAVNNDKK